VGVRTGGPHVFAVEDPYVPSGDSPFPSGELTVSVLVTNVHHPVDIFLRAGQEVMGHALDTTGGATTVEFERARSDHMSRPAVVGDALDDEADLRMALHRAVWAILHARRFVDANLRVRGERVEKKSRVPSVDGGRVLEAEPA
jgi:hypothetical protein